MAIETDNDKLAVMELEDIWEPGLPLSPESLGADDQQQLLWGYPGVLWGGMPIAPVVPPIVIAAGPTMFWLPSSSGGGTLLPIPNPNYAPEESRDFARVTCSVCGFKGIDPYRTQEPEHDALRTLQTGTTYQVPAGTPIEGLSAIDVQTETQIPQGSACPFCGSPAWSWGSAPDLLRRY